MRGAGPEQERRNGIVSVLYVDDSLFDRELVRDALEREHGGFLITEASSRVEFEALLAAGHYDLVLSDFEISGFQELDVVDLVRTKDSNLPVVIVAGTGSEQAAVEAMKRGAADYVIKTPQQIRRLPGTIFAALERRRRHEARLRAEDAQRLLVDAGAVLASALDYEDNLRALSQLVVPGFGDLCAIRIADDRTVGGVIAAALEPGGEKTVHEMWHPGRLASHWQEAVRATLQTQDAQILSGVPEPLLATIVDSTEQLKWLIERQVSSAIVVPLVARGHRLGLLLLGKTRDSYGPEDLALASELGGRIALAADNARLYRDATEAIRVRDEFLAVAAHELRTPVTSLKGFAQMAMRLLEKGDNFDPEQIHQAMEVINLQSDRLTQLMSRLLDVSRIEANRLELVLKSADVVRLVLEVVERVRVGNQGRIIDVSAPHTAPALVDSPRLEQVLTNLLDNAVKFSPGGEPVEVEVAVPSPDTVAISVTDHGVGIPPERQQSIFDRFYQAHGNRGFGGMGLGLYISRRIVELHGGTIQVGSPTGGGTRFVVTLPTGVGACRDGAAALPGHPQRNIV